MLRLHKDHPKQPVPDWPFKQDETLLHAETADKLIEKIILYRLANGQYPGEPEHEVALSLKRSHPHLVYEEEGTAEQRTQDSVWGWVNLLWRDPPKGEVTDEEVKRRAEICKACPFSKQPKPHAEMTRRAYLLARGSLLSGNYCDHHDWHNGVAVTLASPREWMRPEPPPVCWVASVPPP